MLGPRRFRFLNEEHIVQSSADWNNPDTTKLWLYHLHYFEDLNALGADQRQSWHRDLIQDWLDKNPPFQGVGWEPYPLSIRIGHWIKWVLKGNQIEQSWQQSLALQAEHLFHRIEWHLLGNHLFENAKALILAGMFFHGKASDRWMNKGLSILTTQLKEQILSDGGHFERSPMYHSIVLEGLLDLIQISECYGLNHQAVKNWRHIARKMLAWLNATCHPDGEIAFFNDAAFDVALSPKKLAEYAKHCKCETDSGNKNGITMLDASGYIKFQQNNHIVLLDVAPLGPDYLPGHGHADTLSFELSLFGQRIIVNSGTSVYGTSLERLRQRGTSAHSTLQINEENSSEVWSGFRVARRARPQGLAVYQNEENLVVHCQHEGYRRLSGNPRHRRTWRMSSSGLAIKDEVIGEFECAVSRLYVHPNCELKQRDDETITIDLPTGQQVTLKVNNGRISLLDSTYHPEFGHSISNKCIVIELIDKVMDCEMAWIR